MGFFDDLFGGAAYKKAGEAAREHYNDVNRVGRADASAASIAGMDAIVGGTDLARTGLGQAYGTGQGAINAGAGGALDYLNQGTTGALGALGGASAAYDPLSALATKYGGATSLGLNALGVNGAGAQGDARAAFQAGPGYNFNLDQGLEAINRRRAAGGMLNSGNADRDAQVFGSGLASQEHDKWLQNLLGFTSPELAATSGAASGRAGVATNQANLLNQSGINRAGIATGQGTSLANLASGYGSNIANLETGKGTSLADLFRQEAQQKIGLSATLAQPYGNTFQQQAAGQSQGAGNLANFGINLAKLGAQFAGGF